MDDRSLIDPENRHTADGLRVVERNALRVLACCPCCILERTRDVIQLSVPGDRGIVVVVTPEAIEIRLPTVEWTMGAYGPADSSRLWRRLGADRVSDDQLRELLERAVQVRAAQFKPCRWCHARLPPEHRHGAVCHDCAEKHLGHLH